MNRPAPSISQIKSYVVLSLVAVSQCNTNCEKSVIFILASCVMLFKLKNTSGAGFVKYRKNQAREHPPSIVANQAVQPQQTHLANHDATEASIVPL